MGLFFRAFDREAAPVLYTHAGIRGDGLLGNSGGRIEIPRRALSFHGAHGAGLPGGPAPAMGGVEILFSTACHLCSSGRWVVGP